VTGEDRSQFRFGPPTRRGVLAGVRASQLASLTVALVISVGLLRGTPARVALPVSIVLVLATVGFAFVPVAGSTVQSWVPVLCAYLARGLIGGRRSVTSPVRAAVPLRPPAPFTSLGIEAVAAARGRSIGALVDRREQTITGALRIRPVALGLLGPAERDRVIASWGHVLAAVGTGMGVHRLQWLERTVPDRAAYLRAALEQSAAFIEGGDAGIRRARDAYARLCAGTERHLYRHECLLAMTLRSGTRVRRARSDAPEELARSLELLEARCVDAGFVVDEILDPDGLVAALRASTDRMPHGYGDGPFPLAVDEHWDHLLTDGVHHATYWVASWPRQAVRAEFLLPLLVGAAGRRTISVTVSPVAATRAVHEAEQARTSGRADLALRAHHGFALTARTRAADDATRRREEELAEGHAPFRFSGYVTVSEASADGLAQSCDRLEQAAALSRLDLRRLYGEQAEAFLATIPLGRGCA
jgi:hypothetical protein